MIETIAMLFVLVASFMAMLALVKFAQRIIDRPQDARRRAQPLEMTKSLTSA